MLSLNGITSALIAIRSNSQSVSRGTAAVVAFSCMAVVAPLADAAHYDFTLLHNPNWVTTAAFGLNDSNDIVGQYQLTASGYTHGFLLSGGTYTTIDYPCGGGCNTRLVGISKNGQIVGWKDSQSFIKTGSSFINIEYPGAGETEASGINDSGDVVGGYLDATLRYAYAFLYHNGAYTKMDAPGSLSASTVLTGINNSGQMIGWFTDTHNIKHGLMISGGVYTHIDFPGATVTELYAISNNGDVAGQYTDAGGVDHAFIYHAGVFEEIAGPSSSHLTDLFLDGLNDSENIVTRQYDFTTNSSSWYFGTPANSTGTIQVNSNVPGAWFTITGPQNYAGLASSTCCTITAADSGSYTITWLAVSGYNTPASQTLSLGTGGTITFSGTYNKLPDVVSLTPTSGSGHTVTFEATYSDPSGAPYLFAVRLLVASDLTGKNACYVYADIDRSRLWLMNDAGSAWLGPAQFPGGTLSNSQCTLGTAATYTYLADGHSLKLDLPVTFTNAMIGSRAVYLLAEDRYGSTGWVNEGTWTPNPTLGSPAVVSLTPSTGSGSSAMFAAVYSDPNGTADLGNVRLLMNTQRQVANACYVDYNAQRGLLYLSDDSGSGWLGPLRPGVAGTVSNSRCTLDGGASTVSVAGNNLTLNVALSFSNTFTANQNVYLFADAVGGGMSGWVLKGNWTP